MVEHDLAKVGVASSSLVFRSGSRSFMACFFVLNGTKNERPAPRGSCRHGRLRGLRKEIAIARVRGLESRFPLRKQVIYGLLFCFKRDEERAARSPRELSAWPTEGSTKGDRDCPRPRARVSFSAQEAGHLWPAFFVSNGTKNERPAPRGSCRHGRLRGL